MKRRTFMRAVAACAVAGGTAFGAVAIGASSAGASTGYGQGAVAQVELSANANSGAFWMWAALDGNQTSGTLTYEETDCIHLGGGNATDQAANDTNADAAWSPNGGTVATYAVSGGTLTLSNVAIIGGALTANIAITLPANSFYGHSSGVTVTVAAVNPNLPPSVVAQLPPVGASFSYNPGPESQTQIAS